MFSFDSLFLMLNMHRVGNSTSRFKIPHKNNDNWYPIGSLPGVLDTTINIMWVYFQLFLLYLEKWLCKIHLDFWIMVVYHHSHLQCNQEGHHFITGGFIGPQILNFERSLSLSRGPKAVLFRLAIFLLEALIICLTRFFSPCIGDLSRFWLSW